MRYILLSLLHSIFTRGKETYDKILLGTCDDPGTGGEDILWHVHVMTMASRHIFCILWVLTEPQNIILEGWL